MANLHIEREHSLGLDGARRIAQEWARQAETDFDMTCSMEETPDGDCVHFSRTGAKGTLTVSAQRFELDAQLGFLLGAFKERIEGEIGRKLDELLGQAGAA